MHLLREFPLLSRGLVTSEPVGASEDHMAEGLRLGRAPRGDPALRGLVRIESVEGARRGDQHAKHLLGLLGRPLDVDPAEPRGIHEGTGEGGGVGIFLVP